MGKVIKNDKSIIDGEKVTVVNTKGSLSEVKTDEGVTVIVKNDSIKDSE